MRDRADVLLPAAAPSDFPEESANCGKTNRYLF
jgi:hypothetical protein